jgi:hypothetical protein
VKKSRKAERREEQPVDTGRAAKTAAPKRAAAPAEAAPTQKEVLRDQPKRRRTLRDEGVEG